MEKEAKLFSSQEFGGLLDRLGPFATAPRLSVGVSGGADSLALAILAKAWTNALGGHLLALVVDHRLRPASGDEACTTVARLNSLGVEARVITLDNLRPGPALAARARAARLAALADACTANGITDLLLGHHAGDQAETLMIRALAGTTRAGFAGIAALREIHTLRVLRPLLSVPPARLRATLRAAGIDWVEDPSNSDRHAQRARLRSLRTGGEDRLLRAAADAGARRAADEAAIADILARRATLTPEGYALLTPGPIQAASLAALLRTIAGAAYPIAEHRIAALARAPGPATIAGVRLLAAGRRGPPGTLLLVREAAAQAPSMAARAGALWDGRFRLLSDHSGATIGPLGAADAARWHRHPRFPAAVLATLPALRRNDVLVSASFLRYDTPGEGPLRVQFCPVQPAAGAPWRA